MKRILAVLLLLVIVFTFTACGNRKAYDTAQTLFDSGDYEKAADSFERLGDYEDSSEKAKMARNIVAYNDAVALWESGDYQQAAEAFKSLGDFEDCPERMTDCLFLVDIEESILNRIEQSEKNTALSKLVDTELAYVGTYDSVGKAGTPGFSDANLQSLAQKYIKGLKDQKAALEIDTNKSEFQIAWQNGYVERLEVLNALYEKYGLLKNDRKFVANYVMALADEQKKLWALHTIDDDLNAQLDNIMFDYVDSYHFSAPYTNNTQYSFDLSFVFYFYNENEVRVGESTNTFNSIRSRSDNTLKFYCPTDEWTMCDFYWTINDIKWS